MEYGHTKATDLWSLGVLLLELSVGCLPDFFSAEGIKPTENPLELRENLFRFYCSSSDEKRKYLKEHCKCFSSDNKDLLEIIINLTESLPEYRMNAKEACNYLILLNEWNKKDATSQVSGTLPRRRSLHGDSLRTSTTTMQRRHSMPDTPGSLQTSDRTDESLPGAGVPADSLEP